MKIGSHKTRIVQEGEATKVFYHDTSVVTFDQHTITLNTGGWNTSTTKKRMNQTSSVYGLNFQVYQKNFAFYCDYNGKEIPFEDSIMVLTR